MGKTTVSRLLYYIIQMNWKASQQAEVCRIIYFKLSFVSQQLMIKYVETTFFLSINQ